MNSSFSLSETDLLGLVRQEGLMVIDSIAIKNRRQVDRNREILECDLIGRRSNRGTSRLDSECTIGAEKADRKQDSRRGESAYGLVAARGAGLQAREVHAGPRAAHDIEWRIR